MRLSRPSPSVLLSFLALVMACGGTSIAQDGVTAAARLITGKQVKDNTITGRDVKNGSLRAADFAAGALPAGPQGPRGETGPAGPQGPQGSMDTSSFYDKAASDDRFLAKTAVAADSHLLDGLDATAFATTGHDHDTSYYTKTQGDARYARPGAPQTWQEAQHFIAGLSVNALARTGNYSMSNNDSAILISPDAATQWVELPCAISVGAGRIAIVKKMNTLHSIDVFGCPPGTEKIDNQSVINLPAATRGSLVLMSRGTSNGWVIVASHGL